MYMCVLLVYFLTLRISIFEKKIMENKKHKCVNKTSRDKGGACANEKRERCNRIPSEITLGRNYPSAGYTCFSGTAKKSPIQLSLLTNGSLH